MVVETIGTNDRERERERRSIRAGKREGRRRGEGGEGRRQWNMSEAEERSHLEDKLRDAELRLRRATLRHEAHEDRRARLEDLYACTRSLGRSGAKADIRQRIAITEGECGGGERRAVGAVFLGPRATSPMESGSPMAGGGPADPAGRSPGTALSTLCHEFSILCPGVPPSPRRGGGKVGPRWRTAGGEREQLRAGASQGAGAELAERGAGATKLSSLSLSLFLLPSLRFLCAACLALRSGSERETETDLAARPLCASPSLLLLLRSFFFFFVSRPCYCD